MKALAEGLKTNTVLKKLNLSNCDIGDKGVCGRNLRPQTYLEKDSENHQKIVNKK